MDVRSADGHLTGDRERQWAEVAGCRVWWSKQRRVCTPPIRPSATEFIWSRKRDGSVIGRSARSAAKYGHRGSRVGEATPPKNQLLDRLRKFANGEWIDLLGLSREASVSAASIRSRRSRTRVDTVEKRVERAEALISMGEISAARHALEGSPGQRGHSERIEG